MESTATLSDRRTGVNLTRWADASRALVGGLLLLAIAVGTATLVVTGSPLLRVALAAALVLCLLALLDADFRVGLIATLTWTCVLALARRMLIEQIGWETNDALLLVAPIVLAVLLLRVFVFERRRLAADRLSYAVLALVALTAIASINPRNGSLAVGLGGMLFMGVPLFWFFVGREYVDRAVARSLLTAIVALATLIATYGFFQSLVVLPSWDRAWVDIAGYGALFLEGNTPNTFGTFSSTAEYTLFIGIAIVAVVAFAVHGRVSMIVVLPLLLPAIFLSSARTSFIFTLLAVVMMLAIRFLPPKAVPFALILSLAALIGGSGAIMGALQQGASSTSNARVEYQLGGLGDPLNREQSSVTLHAELLYDGIRTGMTDPIGRGSGVTNNAVRRFGPGGENAAGFNNTEIDVSNAFVSLGLIGGLVFVFMSIVAFGFAVKAYLFERDAVTLAILGVLIATFGNWLSGGHYAATPVIWILLGTLAAIRLRQASLLQVRS